MKKLIIVSLVFLFAISLVQGQTKKEESKKEQKTERTALKKLEGNNVSKMAKESFQSDFGTVQNVQWKRNGTFDEAVFKKDGKQLTAFYDIEGKLVGTTKEASWSDLSPKEQAEIKKTYSDYTVGPVIFFDDNEANETDMVMYGIQFDDTDTYLVELNKGAKKIVVQVDKQGLISFFKQL